MVNRRLWDGNKSCTIAFCYASHPVNTASLNSKVTTKWNCIIPKKNGS